jgi:eukaryotic-like serine/threonine-protein kinase
MTMSEPLLAPGDRLGPYRVDSSLGAGGMGEVYRAVDTRLGRAVAVKVLSGPRAQDPDRLRRFEREARVVAALSHANVLALHDVGSQDGVDYAVFELLEGQTLRRRLDSGPLPVSKAVEYGVQICQGLDAIHARGIVHRDLKPDNVFLMRSGQVKILDFGLAKLGPRGLGILAGGSDDRTATEPGLLVGTCGYMAPEQARGRPADPRSDIFSVGAILYEMLSGRRAFAGPTPADTLAALLTQDPPDISALSRPIPRALERVVRQCLERSPEERFQSARDVAFGLQALSTSDVTVPPRRSGSMTVPVALLALAGAFLLARGRSAKVSGNARARGR